MSEEKTLLPDEDITTDTTPVDTQPDVKTQGENAVVDESPSEMTELFSLTEESSFEQSEPDQKKRRLSKKAIFIAGITTAAVIVIAVSGIIIRNAVISKQAIDVVIASIDSIGTVTNNDESKTLIDNALSEYNNLSEKQKSKVTNYDLLQAKINEYNTLLGIRTVIYDFAAFPGNGTSYVKEETTVTINDVSFTASNHGTGAGFILGANTKNYTEPNSKYNVGNWSKYSILEFNVADLSEIAFTVSKLYSGINECHILYSADGLTYTEEWSFKPVEGEEFFYDFSTSTTGYFVILVEGSQPRMGIANFTLKYITK